MAVGFSNTNKPINPRGADASPKGYNRASLFSGKALDFDGVNDHITFGTISDLTFGTGDFSAVLDWQIDSVSTYSWAIAKNPVSDFGIGINNTGGLLRLWIGGTLSLGTENILGSDWKKIAVVRESGVVSAYINGVAISLTETAMAGSIDSGELFVGSWVSSADFWNGLLNNIRIFNTALTAAQVADLYNNPEKVVPTGVDNTALKLWLPMQEGAGTTAYDGSSTENGPDLIVNGDFATDSDWTKGAGWSIGGGVATHDSSLGPGDLYQDFNLTIGKSYKITIEITATDTTELYFMTDSGDYVEVTGSPIGVHSHVFVADDSLHRVGVRGSGNWDGSVDNITLEELNFANHGTISGATWTHGIGAPVAQTAVIDWNKGTNLFEKSEQFGVSPWSLARVTITNGIETAPDGRVTASRALEDSATGYRDAFISSDTFAAGVPITLSCFVKGGLGRDAIYLYTNNGGGNGRAAKFNINTGAYIGDASGSGFSAWDSYTSEDFGNGWFRFSATINSNTNTTSRVYNLGISDNTNDALAGYVGDVTKGIYFWGASLEQSATAGPYVRTGATAQTSPVLLPQGLTSGRDITGVNLFENVRKQGALNLDGNSWAEVHDNESLDITDAVSLEMWIYWEEQSQDKTILGKWVSGADRAYALLATTTTGRIDFRQRVSSSTFVLAISTLSSGWNHVVATHDHSANERFGYINGVLVSQSTSQGVSNESDNNITIGGISTAQYTNSIAQPRIYNRALTAEEVARNYNSGKAIYTNS